MAALWRLSLFKLGDNPGKVSFAKHSGPFQQPAWLYSVLKNRSCQGLSPNPCCDWGHPKHCNHYAIWLVWIFDHTFWAVQGRTNLSTNDGLRYRWFGRCVCIHGRFMSRFSGQTNTPLPSGCFFHSFSHQWSQHQQTQNHVIQLLIVNYWLLRQQSNISVVFAKVSFSPLDRSQTLCDCPFLHFSPHFTQTTMPPGIYLLI